jgi:hypothetical protein
MICAADGSPKADGSMQRERRMKSLIVHAAGLALLSLFVLAGCGDDGSPSDPPMDPTDAGLEETGEDAAGDVQTDAPTDAAPLPDVAQPDTDTGPPDADDVEPPPQDVAGPDAPFFDPDVPTGPDATGPPIEAGDVLIFGIDPPSGPREGGTFVVVFGDGFTPDAEVLIGGRRLEGIDVVDGGTIVGFTPAGTTGPTDVKVVSLRGQGILPSGFRYVERLAIESLDPGLSPERGGVPVVLRGTGFSAESRVSIGGQRLADMRVVDATRIEGVAPPGRAGDAEVRVTIANGTEARSGFFTYFAEPSLTSVRPGAGPQAGGITATLSGAWLGEGAIVVWDGRVVPTTRRSETELEVSVPAGSPGSIDVAVEVPGRGTAVLRDAFRYLPASTTPGVPVGVSPSFGDVAGGDLVWVAGVGLEAADAILFGDEPAVVVDETEWAVQVRTPPASSVGPVDVTIVGDEEETLTDAFTYVLRPRASSVEPDEGPVEGGNEVLIRGAGWTAAARVRFGVAPATIVRISPDGLVVRAPAGAAGTVDVRIEEGDATVVLADAYQWVGPLRVDGLVPSRGAIAGNTYVVLRGENFADDVSVRFGAVPATDIVRLDASSIAVRTPPGTPGAVSVEVTSAGETLTAPVPFTYYDPWRRVGGWWGGAIDGSVNVTVIDSETNERIPGAFVTLAVRVSQRQFDGYTNANGQVTLSGPGLRGTQNVSASAVGYSSVTVANVNAENVIIFLTPPEEDGDGDPPPPPLDPAIIEGVLTGLDKIAVPGPDEILVGIIRTSTPVPGGRNPPGTGYAEVRYAGNQSSFPYSMASRFGEVAVVAICGAFNQRTGEFRPVLMGLRRGLNTRTGQTYTVNVECNIPLGETMTFKFLSSPVGTPGITRNLAVPFIDLGGEGGFDLLQSVQGPRDTLTLNRLASLDHPDLAGTTYFVLGEAGGDDGLPFSVAFQRTIRTTRSVVELGPMLPPAELRFPAPPARRLVERRFEWSLATSARPDFYYAFITDLAQDAIYWEVWVPGDENGFNLPFFPPGEETSDIPPGPLVLIVLSIDAYTFNYDEFSFNDFGQNNWRAYSANGWVFTNPE